MLLLRLQFIDKNHAENTVLLLLNMTNNNI